MRSKTSLFFLALLTLVSSCEKEEGEGGRASIKGKVYAEYWDKTFTIKADSGYAPDVDVYIVYGNNPTFGNRTKANFDGTYEFKYLQEGNYRIYAYSKDSTGRAADQANGNSNYQYNPDIAVFQSVEITERKQIAELDDIKVLK